MTPIFFIPATKINKVRKILDLGVEEIIIDFEDSVLISNREENLNNILQLKNYKDFWYRIPIRNSYKEKINFDFLNSFIEKGICKLIIPKIISKEELEEVLSRFKNLKFIILVEHPKLLLEINQILQNINLSQPIYGLGLGSHDLLSSIKAIHDDQQLDYPRKKLLYSAKAYNKLAIDIASMNISNRERFEKEIKYGISNGFDSKFIIHPLQLKWLQEFETVKREQILWAKKIINALPKNIIGKEIEPIVVEGEIIEKPHVEKALNILKKYNYEK